MRVAQRVAGYSLADADNLLRKACGKKERELIAVEREKFIDGSERSGYGRDLGTQLFDIIEPFADYAFDKSHAFGYGLVAYQTAYLKAHHPVEYLACLLTSVKSSLEKAAVYIAECRALGIRVLTPDINRSVTDFAALAPDEVPDGVALPLGSPGAITFGLSAVRNVGTGLVAQLLAERDEHGPFASFHEFAERVPEPVLNKRAVESLIKAGGVRLARAHSQGVARRVRARHRRHADPPARARTRRDEPVRRPGRRGRRRARVRRAAADPRRRVREGRQAAPREGDARPVRVGPSAVRRRGGAAAEGRAGDHRRRRARRRGDGPRRWRGHRVDPEVHQARRPDGGVRARGPRVEPSR